MRYYVYCHVAPDGEIVYVGKGCGGRAWDVTRARRENHAHSDWMIALCEQGHIPTDWVVILNSNLSEKEARRKETEYIHEHGIVKFNRQTGEKQHQAKLTNDQVISIYKDCKNKIPHKFLAEQYGVSRSTISMISSRKQWRAVTAGVAI